MEDVATSLARIEARLDELARGRLRTLLTVDDVATTLQVSRRTVETLISSGHLTPIRIGRQRRIHPAALDAFLRYQTGRAA